MIPAADLAAGSSTSSFVVIGAGDGAALCSVKVSSTERALSASIFAQIDARYVRLAVLSGRSCSSTCIDAHESIELSVWVIPHSEMSVSL